MADNTDKQAPPRFTGTGVALITPFRSDGSIDDTTLARLVERQIEEGTDFLVPCGTTGENPALSFAEHMRVIDLTIAAADGAVPVLAGAGSNSTEKTIEFSLAAIDLGADGLLTITPYYNKPGPDGLVRHFTAQSHAITNRGIDCPMVLYNVPGRTGCNITPATLKRLQKIPGVIGVKEASGDLGQIQRILHERPAGFLVLSGDDALTLSMIALGADGLVSVASNEIPRQMSDLVRAARTGDFERAREIHFSVLDLMEANFIESNPAPAKALMKMMGILPDDTLRSPLAPVSEESRIKLREIAVACGLIEGESK